jgi:hypothetical protein
MSGWGEFHDYDFDDPDDRSMFADPGGEGAALWFATEQDYNKPYAPSGARG